MANADVKHSSKYDKVKKYYDDKMWSLKMVKNAVVKKWITAEEFEEITGEVYKNV